jgi:hypothetical protein
LETQPYQLGRGAFTPVVIAMPPPGIEPRFQFRAPYLPANTDIKGITDNLDSMTLSH